jgi:hypothetical protein
MSPSERRGDWTQLELFLAGIRGWEAGFRRNVAMELVITDRNDQAQQPAGLESR